MRSGNKKFAKKAVCWILSLAMVVVFIPFSSFATEKETNDVEAAGFITNQILMSQIIAKEATENAFKATAFWGGVLANANKQELIKTKEAVDLAHFIGGDLATKGLWAQWAAWGKILNSDLPEKLLFWPGVAAKQAFDGFTVPVRKFNEIGEDAMQALAGMLMFSTLSVDNTAKMTAAQLDSAVKMLGNQALMANKAAGDLAKANLLFAGKQAGDFIKALEAQALKAGKQAGDIAALLNGQALKAGELATMLGAGALIGAGGATALIATQIPAAIAKQVKTWGDLESAIKDLKLPFFEMPKVTIPDLEWMKLLYPKLDWTKVFELAKFDPAKFGLDKISGEWAEIPFDIFMNILKEASKLGQNIDLNNILPRWNWQGKYLVCDWAKYNFKCWGDLINLDFMSYLKNLQFPIDSLGFKLILPDLSKLNLPGLDPAILKNLVPPCGFMLPMFQTEITSVTGTPVKSTEIEAVNGLLENLGGYTLADKDGYVVFDKDGKAKVLYKVVVQGTPGATFSLENENAKLVFAPLNALGVPVATQLGDGSIKGYIPLTHAATGNVTLYVAKDYTPGDVKAPDKYSKNSYLPLHFIVKSNTSLVKIADQSAPTAMVYVDNQPTVTLSFDTNGGNEIAAQTYPKGSTVTVNAQPFKAGNTFKGWFYDEALTLPVGKDGFVINEDTTIYAKWAETPVPEWLNGTDHIAYLIGYPDGYVKPGKFMTRAEVATVLFRLLKDEYRTKYLTKSNKFDDVKAGAWYNTAISTLAAMGILNGRTDTLFAPNAIVTRGEFITMCARFDSSISEGSSYFKDTLGNWAKEYVDKIFTLGWAGNTLDGYFLPNNSIPRSEVATIINRILQRIPGGTSDLLDNMVKWPDNNVGDWYYLAMQEATNSHKAEYKADGTEKWTELVPNVDWKKYEY